MSAWDRAARSALLEKWTLRAEAFARQSRNPMESPEVQLRAKAAEIWTRQCIAELEAAGLAAGDRPSLDEQPWRQMATAPEDGRFFIALLADHRLAKLHWCTEYLPHDFATPEGFYVPRPIGWIPLPTGMDNTPRRPDQLQAKVVAGDRTAPPAPEVDAFVRTIPVSQVPIERP